MFRAIQLVYVIPLCLATAGIGAGGALYATHAPVITAVAVMPAPGRETRTVTWYRAHPDEAQRKNAACDNNLGAAMRDDECINADSAR